MAANIHKILIIGATSGIGEGLARALHAQGSSVILVGRRQDRLDSIASSLQNSAPMNSSKTSTVHTLQWDVSDLSGIPKTVASLLSQHPDLTHVLYNSGTMSSFSPFEPSSTDDATIQNEVTTNLTAFILVTRAILPHLATIASQSRHAGLMATTSGLAYVPVDFCPVYCATKAAMHSFLVSTRISLGTTQEEVVGKHLSICEIAPPLVDTEFVSGLRGTKPGLMKHALALQGYLDGVMKVIGGDGKLPWEVEVAEQAKRAELWSGAMRGYMSKQAGYKEV